MRPIAVGQHVAYRYKGTMEVGVVTKIGRKQLSIERLSTSDAGLIKVHNNIAVKARPDNVYPEHAVIVPDDAVVMWLLQGKKSSRY